MNSGSKVFYQGIEGSFSSKAATILLPTSGERVGTNRFIEIFEGMKNNPGSFGVIPIENSLAGSIHENYDLLARYKPTIIGEYYLQIAHHLMMKKNEADSFDEKRLRKVYSHPKALEQCREFLETPFTHSSGTVLGYCWSGIICRRVSRAKHCGDCEQRGCRAVQSRYRKKEY